MSFNAARFALDAGVVPFTIGGDIHGYTIRRRDESSVWGAGAFGGEQGQLTTIGGTGAFSLVQVMNELIALGVGLTDVIRMVTVNAATMLGLTDELGSLAPGRVADVSVLAVDEDDPVLDHDRRHRAVDPPWSHEAFDEAPIAQLGGGRIGEARSELPQVTVHGRGGFHQPAVLREQIVEVQRLLLSSREVAGLDRIHRPPDDARLDERLAVRSSCRLW